ncbi:MAG: ArsR family transcriptional regulator [Nitrososphaerota archaeon]|nr:ArsR family transcriptional regulator [Nitrososphaerota archaeon]
MSQEELDTVLGAVENPLRRRIIEKLSQEPNYQLQLSKQLGCSQQLVAKHLESIEGAGLVGTVLEDSPRGPQRKEYLLKKSVSVTLDVAPNLFRARVFSFGMVPELDPENAQIISRMNEALRYRDEASRLGPLAGIINEVDRKLKQMEEERVVLLYLRNLALQEAARASSSLGIRDRKKVLRYILREQRDGAQEMSSALGISRRAVGGILEGIEKEFSLNS